MMKIKKGYILRNVAGQHIVLPVGKAAVDFNGLIRLNDSGRLLFETLMDGADENELTKRLLQHYDIDEKTAKKDVATFLNTLRSKDILDENE